MDSLPATKEADTINTANISPVTLADPATEDRRSTTNTVNNRVATEDPRAVTGDPKVVNTGNHPLTEAPSTINTAKTSTINMAEDHNTVVAAMVREVILRAVELRALVGIKELSAMVGGEAGSAATVKVMCKLRTR